MLLNQYLRAYSAAPLRGGQRQPRQLNGLPVWMWIKRKRLWSANGPASRQKSGRSASENPSGTLKPFYLTRAFKYLKGCFRVTNVNSADLDGVVPRARIFIKRHIIWRNPHPIAAGAQKFDFVADQAY